MTEVWRQVDDFPGYEVSSAGRVRRTASGQGAVAGRILKWHTATSTGYPTIRMQRGGICRGINVHKLVTRAFIGPMPDGMVTRHLDGDKMNNSSANLCYGTQLENNRDKVRHGTSSTWFKLSPEAVVSIRAQKAAGESARNLAAVFGVSVCHVHRICAWKLRTKQAQEASNRNVDRAAA